MATALLAQLRAWRSVLQGLGPLRVPQPPTYPVDEEEHDSSQLVLVLDAGRLTCDATLRIISEALSALTLLARLDIGAWRKEVCAVWPQVDLQSVLDRSRRDIVMGLRFAFDTVASLDPLATRMLLLDGYSPEFRSLLAEVKKEMATSTSSERYESETSRFAHPLVPVSLTFGRPVADQPRGINSRLYLNGIIADVAALEKVEQIVRVQTMNAAHRHLPEMVLKIASLKLNDHELAFEPAGIALLGRLVQSGIHVQDVPVIRKSSTFLYPTERVKEDHDLTSGLRSLLAVTGSCPANKHYGVNELKISMPVRIRDMRSLLSALQQSQSLRSLTIEDVGNERQFVGDRREFWRWLGYALFSPRAGHRIQRLELNLPHLQMSDVTAVQTTTTASNPHALVDEYGIRSSTRGEGTQFYVTLGPYIGPESETIPYRTDLPIEVSVLDDVEVDEDDVNKEAIDRASWLMVRFPGCENARIARNNFTFLADRDHFAAECEVKRTFETVILRGLTIQSMRAKMSMLRFFGKHVRRLELHGVVYNEDDGDEWLHQVLMECPLLEELVIVASDIRRLTPLLHCINSRESRLRLLRVDSMRSTGDLNDLFHALCNRTHPISRLQEIDIDMGVVDHSITFKRIREVLEFDSRRLQVIRMRAKTTVEVYARIRSRADTIFTIDPHAPDTKRVYPLDRRCKLAVLSVAYSANKASAFGQLSPELLVVILDFASHVCFRRMALNIA